MKTRHLHTIALALLATVVLAAAACGASNRGQPTTVGQGRLVVSLVDAPVPQVSQVVVNITKVTAHSDSAGWIDVTPPTVSQATPFTVDLLALQAPALPVELGLVDLPPGRITQLRLYVTQDGNYVVPAGGTAQVPLKVPSGAQSGIKIHGPWVITACSQLSIVLDFDAKKSIWYHPEMQGSEWILRPVIHTKRAVSEPVGCDEACSDLNPCPEGQTCGADGQCTSPGPAPVGADCLAPLECLSGVCDEAHHCGPGGAFMPCQANGDCFSGICDEGACTVPPDASPALAACVINPTCISNSCVGGRCEPGGQGAACRLDSDCAEGMSCTLGSCGMP
jgi:uncharacterized protein DUF4382